MLRTRVSGSAAFLAALLYLVAAAFLLAACGGDDAEAEQPQQAAEQQQPRSAFPERTETNQAPAASNPSGSSASGSTQQSDTTSSTGSSTTSTATTTASGNGGSGGTDDSAAASAEAGESHEEAPQLEPDDGSEPIPYVVKGGDTLADIARWFSVDIDLLIAYNNLLNPNQLLVGQLLYIPTGAAAFPVAGGSETVVVVDPADQIPTGIELPRPASVWGTPLTVRAVQFPQPPADLVLESVPARPQNFLDYGAHALPWLHGKSAISEITDLYRAWPMPTESDRPDRIYLIDTDGSGRSSVALIFNNPDSFAAELPPANLVVFDRVPGAALKYRIAYDHALAYGREPHALRFVGNVDLTGDRRRDLSFRETSCNANGCTSAFYALESTGDGYRVITGPQAIIGDVSDVQLGDATGDGINNLIVIGDPPGPQDGPHRIILAAVNGRLVQHAPPTPR